MQDAPLAPSAPAPGAEGASAHAETKCDTGRPYVSVLDTDAPGSALVALAADPSRGVWAAGQLVGGATFGGVGFASVGGSDAFVAQLDHCGRTRWARTYGGEGEETVLDLVADGAGGAYLLGTFEGTVDFGTGPIVGQGPGRDAFLLKLDADGDVRWWKHVRTLDGGGYVADLALDAEGDVLLLGHLEGEVSLGDATVTSNTITGFAAKIDPDARTIWASLLDTPVDWEPLAIVAAPGGGAFVAGADVRGLGLFALALGAGGELGWAKSFRAPGQFQERFFDLALGEGGAPVLAGEGFLAQGAPAEAQPPRFVAGLGEGGTPSWAEFRAAPPGARLANDAAGGFVLAGHACVDTSLPAPTGCEVTLSRLSPQGAPLETTTLRGDANVRALVADAAGRPLLGGAFEGQVNVGGAHGEASGTDFYVARVAR